MPELRFKSFINESRVQRKLKEKAAVGEVIDFSGGDKK